MKTSDFDYHLPPELIAQTPVEPRDQSRLMVLRRAGGSLEHRRFHEVSDYLESRDCLVFNNSRVIPARLLGRKSDSAANVELLLLRRLDVNIWEALVRPGKKVGVGAKINLGNTPDGPNTLMTAEVLEREEGGIRVLRFSDERFLQQIGEVPLPPHWRSQSGIKQSTPRQKGAWQHLLPDCTSRRGCSVTYNKEGCDLPLLLSISDSIPSVRSESKTHATTLFTENTEN